MSALLSLLTAQQSWVCKYGAGKERLNSARCTDMLREQSADILVNEAVAWARLVSPGLGRLKVGTTSQHGLTGCTGHQRVGLLLCYCDCQMPCSTNPSKPVSVVQSCSLCAQTIKLISNGDRLDFW